MRKFTAVSHVSDKGHEVFCGWALPTKAEEVVVPEEEEEEEVVVEEKLVPIGGKRLEEMFALMDLDIHSGRFIDRWTSPHGRNNIGRGYHPDKPTTMWEHRVLYTHIEAMLLLLECDSLGMDDEGEIKMAMDRLEKGSLAAMNELRDRIFDLEPLKGDEEDEQY